MFAGSIVALITPFDNGKIDENAFLNLVEWQIEQGTHGIVPCGTTGESATITHEEHRRLLQLCVEKAAGRVPVIAGAGSNSTAEAIELAHHAEAVGADAVLCVTPYYNKPTQEGLYQHYKAIHDATNIPIILYNVPSRTGVDLTCETVYRLAELPRIAGIKDASPDLSRPVAMRAELGDEFILLSGEDGTALAYLAQGGNGCIGVTANIAPAQCAQMHEAYQKLDMATARDLNHLLYPLHDAMFCETSPAPVKYAASCLNRASEEVRLPLVVASDSAREQVKHAMQLAKIEA